MPWSMLPTFLLLLFVIQKIAFEVEKGMKFDVLDFSTTQVQERCIKALSRHTNGKGLYV